MLDSIPIVCITGQVSSKFLGTDAFQEVDITGITLPITKHNYIVTRAEEIAPAIREAFLIARSGRPELVLVDITKDAQQAQRHLARNRWQSGDRHRCRPTPNVGGAVLQARRAAFAHYLRGLGTMGFALPAAIGAKVACPEGGLGDRRRRRIQMTSPELATIAQENLAINIAVINNGYLGMVRQWQELIYDRNYACSPIFSPDFVKLADAFGIAGATVTNRSKVLPWYARNSGGPFLIEFQVEKEDGVYPMIAPGAALHEMIRRPDPLIEAASDV